MSFIICMPRDDINRRTSVTEGSTLTNCVECDRPVWISPASVKIMLERDLKPLCIFCIADKPADAELKPPSEEQLKEIVREMKKELENEDPTNRFPGGTTKGE